jgi:hypothetical protein
MTTNQALSRDGATCFCPFEIVQTGVAVRSPKFLEGKFLKVAWINCMLESALGLFSPGCLPSGRREKLLLRSYQMQGSGVQLRLILTFWICDVGAAIAFCC